MRLRGLVRKGESDGRVSRRRSRGQAPAWWHGIGAEARDLHAKDAAQAVIDRIQVQQVLLNLMRNPAEAMVGKRRVNSRDEENGGQGREIADGFAGDGPVTAVSTVRYDRGQWVRRRTLDLSRHG